LAKAGYPVFPLKGDGKEPSVAGGFYAATTDVSQVAEWITEGRGHHNVAFATGLPSGVVVLDADTREAFEEMRAEYGEPAVRTRKGGHWYYRHPRNGRVVSNKIRPGLDRKGDGGYVAAPPSLGRTWTNGIPDRASLPVLPREFWPKKAEASEATRSLPAELKEQAATVIARYVAKIPPGGDKGRHEHLRHACGVLLAKGVAFGDAEDILVAAWTKTGGDLAGRAPREVPNTLRTTEQALAEGRATGVPSLEGITPGLYGELEEVLGWKVRMTVGGHPLHIAAVAGRRPLGEGPPPPHTNGHVPDEPPARFNLTDLGNAERFVARFGQDVRYCYPWGKWLVWTGSRWERDDAGRVHRLAKEAVRGIYAEAAAAEDEDRRKALAQHATRSEAEGKIRAMLELAKSEVPVSPDELDADPYLLNAPNGIVDLRAGELRPHRREDLITKMTGAEYDPDAPASAWAGFLERVLPGEELRGFVRRVSGYSATGDTSEQCMFINHGPGANGKSTFQEALAAALGDYAMRTPTETLLAKRAGGIPNDVARLKGARFVAASETEEGRRLAESLVKDLTGQDTISARFMRAEWFDFKPTHKLWLSTNHKPEIRGTDVAIWRRIRLIPWAVTIPPAKQDRKLADKLRDELPGVLAWAVGGCLEWRREGLRAPDDVRRATAAYRAEMDVLGAFLGECCALDPESNVAAKDLYSAYKLWCDENGEKPETQRRFGSWLTERGDFERYRGGKSGGHRWRGVELLTFWESVICRGSDPTDVKTHINGSENKPRGVMRKKGSEGSEGSAKVPADEQRQRSRRLVHEGMAERTARRSVLGDPSDHPLACECEDCL
jgi:P4 family phage/plasmid primase-like protien